MRLEPATIDEFLEEITDPVERVLQLWYLHDYTEQSNPAWTLLTYDQWVAFTEKYIRVDDYE